MSEFVRFEVADGIGTIRLSKPPMNPLDSDLQEGIRAASAEATSRRDVAAVVVYGGEKVFAAGADIKEMQKLSYTDMVDRAGTLQASFTAVARIPKPTVAAITGYALGGGLELALAADVRFCADDAKLGQPEILLGVIPGAGGTQRLARLIGPSRAKELIFTGRTLDAYEALRAGLVNKVVPAEELLPVATAWAAQFARGPAVALAAAKRAVDEGLEAALDDALLLERQLFAGLFATKDREIGMRSFAESGPGKAEFVGS